MIKINSENYFTYANKFNGDKIDFKLKLNQNLDI
jgi:hypothetical protein